MSKYIKLSVPLMLLISAFITPAVSWAASPIVIYYNWGTPQSPITVRPGYTNQPFVVILQPNAEYKYALLNLTGTPFTNVSGGSLAYSLPSQSFSFFFNSVLKHKPSPESFRFRSLLGAGKRFPDSWLWNSVPEHSYR